MTETIESVQTFLDNVHKLLDIEGCCRINNSNWVTRVNKTQQYMAETGVTTSDIKAVIKELNIRNYCATKDDRNVNFPNEKVWVFGITKTMVDTEEDLYIKLKIRKLDEEYLLIMSFHPEQPVNMEDKLEFPYKDISIEDN